MDLTTILICCTVCYVLGLGTATWVIAKLYKSANTPVTKRRR